MTPRGNRSRAVAAAGVTAAIVATILTAPSAASAADTGAQQVGPLVTETSSFAGQPAFAAPSGTTARPVAANRAATLAAARAVAERWLLPAAGATSTVQPLADQGLCLTALTSTVTNSSPVELAPCSTDDPAQQFTLAANTGSNNPKGTGLRSVHNGGFLGLYNTDQVMRLQSQTVADRVPTLDDFVAAFSATLVSVDVTARTAAVSGTGTAGATVVIPGHQSLTVPPSGSWNTTLGDLPIGTSTVSFQQFEGSTQTGSTTLDVTVDPAPLTFDATFPADIDRPVDAAGTAQRGATVELFDPAGDVLGSAVADPRDGSWSTTIPAPDAGGSYRVRAGQSLSGAPDSAHDVTKDLDYGAAVTVTSPADGAAHAGGPVDLSGTGEAGSRIQVSEVVDGVEQPVTTKPAGVAADGTWTATTIPLDRRQHVLRVAQSGRGANTTTATVTVNPGSTTQLTPVELVSPGSVTPGVTNVFTGTGEPGAQYEVLNAFGTALVAGPLEVGSDGTWSFERVVSTGASEFVFRIVQTKGTVTEPSELFTIAANDGFDPVTVDDGTLRPGEVNRFSGTGPAGATFRVLNSSDTELVPGDQRIDELGRWSFDRLVSKGTLRFPFKLRVSYRGTTYDTQLFTVYVNTGR